MAGASGSTNNDDMEVNLEEVRFGSMDEVGEVSDMFMHDSELIGMVEVDEETEEERAQEGDGEIEREDEPEDQEQEGDVELEEGGNGEGEPERSTKLKAAVWKSCAASKIGDKAQCNICDGIFSCQDGNTTNVVTHKEATRGNRTLQENVEFGF
jgi:hypothetical protein